MKHLAAILLLGSVSIWSPPPAQAEPFPDTPFLQEVVTKFTAGNDGYPAGGALAVAIDEAGRPWVLADGKVFIFDGETWREAAALREVREVKKLAKRIGHPGMIACTESKILALRPGEKPREVARLPFGEPPSHVATWGRKVWVATGGRLYEINNEESRQTSIPGFARGTITGLAVGVDGTLAVGTDGGFFWHCEGRWRHVFAPGLIDGPVTACLVARDGTIWVSTRTALHVLHPDDMWERLDGKDGLPYGDITCLAEGLNGDIWVGSKHGAFRKTSDRWDVYWGQRWLPDNNVRALSVGRDGTAWIVTELGAARIGFKEFTLASKADHYERMIRPRHDRHGLVAGCNLIRPGDLSSWVHRDEDNDGLWTAIYLAAECFRYAVTGDAGARANAIRSFRAMERLETITPIPGFFARSYLHRSEPSPSGGEWHWTEDREWRWKGDTSSDEAVGHFFAYAIYYDLIDDQQEKKRCAALVERIMDHIIRNGYYLVDVDGEPTRWGVWAPEKLNDDPAWTLERGLNSLQILSFLRVAYHVTGNEKYVDHCMKLAWDYGYAENTLNQKIETPWEVNHSDDELAFLPYYSLLLYEDSPRLREIYLRSLERSWQIEIPERSALWNVIYGAVTGKECRIQDALETLRNWPLDLIDWRIDNTGRLDVLFDPNLTRFGRRQLLRVLPPDERPLMRWNGNPYSPVGGGDGRSEDDGSAYLLPYWMARYHNLLAPPGD